MNKVIPGALSPGLPVCVIRAFPVDTKAVDTVQFTNMSSMDGGSKNI